MVVSGGEGGGHGGECGGEGWEVRVVNSEVVNRLGMFGYWFYSHKKRGLFAEFTAQHGALDMELAQGVLVEVTVNDQLPHTLEISYPLIGDKPARIAANVLKHVNANNFAALKSNVSDGDDDGVVLLETIRNQ
nr:hypothetical protein [Tanacetum cinerariifolium]